MQLNEIRKIDSNLPIIGKNAVGNGKEDHDNDVVDDADDDEESEGDEFEEEIEWGILLYLLHTFFCKKFQMKPALYAGIEREGKY